MKTAISLPEDVFAKAEELARRKGLSRSELYVTALVECMKRQDSSQLTEAVNTAIDEVGKDALRADPAVAAHQGRLLPTENW